MIYCSAWGRHDASPFHEGLLESTGVNELEREKSAFRRDLRGLRRPPSDDCDDAGVWRIEGTKRDLRLRGLASENATRRGVLGEVGIIGED